MLFRRRFLDGIEARTVTLAFRRWNRPTVKAGGTLLTSIGVLAILAVDRIEAADATPQEAIRAGFPSLEELLADLERQREAPLYRIRFEVAGEDPRIELRESSELSASDVAALRAKLRRLDERSADGAWTQEVLELIARRPERSAAELAASLGREKEALKLDVRKLKNLGLTESLSPGYRLSPRGRAFLDWKD